jgi:hypothetical protein
MLFHYSDTGILPVCYYNKPHAILIDILLFQKIGLFHLMFRSEL